MNADTLGIIAPHPPIMVPEVGGARASATAASGGAMETAAALLASFAPETVVLMSPHAPVVRDAFTIAAGAHSSGDLGAFGASEVRIDSSGDPALARAIIDEAASAGIPVVPRSADRLLDDGVLDHGALVPLSFLDRAGRYRLIELSLSFLPFAVHRELGGAVRRASEALGRRVAFVASGDCSHRLTPSAPAGYAPRGKDFDEELARIISRGDFAELERIDPDLVEEAGECGLRSFIALGGFLQGQAVETRLLSYEGPWGVGYLTAVSASPELLGHIDTPVTGAKGGVPGDAESELVALARRTIEAYVRDERVLEAVAAGELLSSRHGAFVSLHRGGMLRGCIGTIAPTEGDLAHEIVRNAIQAATADPRFAPLRPDELADLEISVDVLQPAEPAALEDLDPRTYGVIVSADWRKGLLLPDLEGVDTVEDQVAIACRKAGIAPGEDVRLERFRVDRFH